MFPDGNKTWPGKFLKSDTLKYGLILTPCLINDDVHFNLIDTSFTNFCGRGLELCNLSSISLFLFGDFVLRWRLDIYILFYLLNIIFCWCFVFPESKLIFTFPLVWLLYQYVGWSVRYIFVR